MTPPISPPMPFRSAQALLVVDMQNDFVRQGAPQEVPDARAIVPTVISLQEAFRAASRPVIFTRFLAGPQHTLMWRWSPECDDRTRSCWPGTFRSYGDVDGEREGPAIIDELSPLPGEPIVEKYGYNAFHSTNLVDVLRAHHVEQVVVVGTVTQICVEDTVRGGFHHGYEMVVVRDGVASFDDELQAASLRNLGMKFARLADAGEVVAAIQGVTD